MGTTHHKRKSNIQNVLAKTNQNYYSEKRDRDRSISQNCFVENKSREKEMEYERINKEILQYLEEYQTVRNMMYVVTATILGFGINKWNNPYLFLLPLVVILPSYIVLTDYWKCVSRNATYLRVFYEDNINSGFCWESRLAKLNGYYRFMSGMEYQQIPYWSCGILCVVLYFIKITDKLFTHGIKWFINFLIDTGLCGICNEIGIVKSIIGIIALIICIFVFIKFKNVYTDEYIKAWTKMKYDEERE